MMHPAVYFNAKLQPARLSDFREQLDFLQGRMNKGLAAESRVHTHDKNMMNQRQDLVEGGNRGCRVYDHSGLTSVRCDQMKGAIEMDASFLVDGDPIGAGFGKRRDEFIRPFNHEMTIERDPGDLAKRGDDRRPDRDVGYEVAIHDVHVKNGCSALQGS